MKEFIQFRRVKLPIKQEPFIKCNFCYLYVAASFSLRFEQAFSYTCVYIATCFKAKSTKESALTPSYCLISRFKISICLI